MNIPNLFAKGLKAGFGKNNSFLTIDRGGFKITGSHQTFGQASYHDEWITGGGQELVKYENGNMYTRVYAGDCISTENLLKLQITEGEVMSFLKNIIVKFSEKIRFDKEFETKVDEWNYSYKVLFEGSDPLLLIGIETISYKNTTVFIHSFSISRVR